MDMSKSYKECEAAMCLWEECLLRRANGDDALFDWLRGGEGAASARFMCIDFAEDIEGSYQWAQDVLGFDDCFDWEFVPRWADATMELTETTFLTKTWWSYLAYKVMTNYKETRYV
jgi:hypothetical protein